MPFLTGGLLQLKESVTNGKEGDWVSMPFLTGGLLQQFGSQIQNLNYLCFYALSNGRSVATERIGGALYYSVIVSMPFLTGGLLQPCFHEKRGKDSVSMPFLTGGLLQQK